MKKYWNFSLSLVFFIAVLLPAKLSAQTFPLTNITCASPWSGVVHSEDMGEIADPASVTIPIHIVPINFNCQSTQFYEKQPGQWHAYGAACLAIEVTSGSASQRQLTHEIDASKYIKFNFSHSGGTSAADAVGNALGDGVGIPYYGESPGGNSVNNGPALPVGGQVNDLGIYIHANGQAPDLPSGLYEGIFNWKLYAGTTNILPPVQPPSPANCAASVGNGTPIQEGVIKVEVRVKTSCSLTLPQPGNIFDFGTQTHAELAAGIGPITRHLTISCNNNKNMIVTMGAGLHSGGNINDRQMKLDGGSDLIKYNLIKPGGGEWGDDPTNGYQVPGSFGTVQTIPIEARIPPQSNTVTTGEYKDTVHVQLWN